MTGFKYKANLRKRNRLHLYLTIFNIWINYLFHSLSKMIALKNHDKKYLNADY
jgi:hypothetical protein